MLITDTLEELNRILQRIESAGWEIEHIELKEERLTGEEPLHLKVGVSLPVLDILQDETNVRIEGPSIENSTTILTVTIPAKERDEADRETPKEKNKSDNQEKSNTERTDGRGEQKPNESATLKPAHHDPERLREVYEEHETFAEMTEALGVDVSPQTVRHFMIRHEIHEPSSHSPSPTANIDENNESGRKGKVENPRDVDRTGSKEEDLDTELSTGEDQGQESDNHTNNPSSSNQLTDGGNQKKTSNESDTYPISNKEIHATQLEGVSLPEHVSIDDVKDAVQSSSTVHDVRQALDLDGPETRELLKELNLLDLVAGRLAYKPNQDQQLDEIKKATDSMAEIENRIHGALNQQTSTNKAD